MEIDQELLLPYQYSDASTHGVIEVQKIVTFD